MNKSSNSEFYINDFYDGLMMLVFKKPIPPKQRKGRSQNRNFEEYLRSHLKSVKQNKWPMKGKLMVFISVTGPNPWIENVDVDNVSKSVLDCIKDIVIEDDSNVYALFADKRIDQDKSGILIGIKMIHDHNDYYEKVIPPYFTDQSELISKEDAWWLVFDDSTIERPF